MNLMKFKIWYFIFSLLIILPGLYYLLTSGLRLGVEFTGGSLLEYRFERSISSDELRRVIASSGVQVKDIITTGNNTYLFRTKLINQDQLNQLNNQLPKNFGKTEERSVASTDPIIGSELKQKTLIALFLASLMIVLYIAYSFRKIPKPTASWRFGIAAIVALMHDVLVVVGVFAILGKFFSVEVDILFVTALLTVIGFSVHDTIVVFDRIRENLLKNMGKKFITIANLSVVQTLGRSLNTSLTVIFVLLALLLFGGETIRWFVVALLIGIISGTYSSIFNATAMLVWWEEKLGH